MSKGDRAPSFQFYAARWLASTRTLSLAARGAYVDLLAWSWDNGPLPAELAARGRIVGAQPAAFRRLWAEIADKWAALEDGTGFVNNRLEGVRRERGEYFAEQARKGAARWESASAEAKRTRAERLSAARAKGTHTAAEWAAVVAFFGGACVRCGEVGRNVKDHIIPIYQGGSDAITNLQPLCITCNASKGPDCTDWRIGKGAPAEWLPSVAGMPAGMPAEAGIKCLPNAFSTSTSTSTDLSNEDPDLLGAVPQSEAGARATTDDGRPWGQPAPVWRRPGTPGPGSLVDRPADHRGHGVCLPRGLCVPRGLHAELVARHGGDPAELSGWYRATVAALGDRPIGDDVWQFWRGQFAAWVGTVGPAEAPRAGKGGRAIAALEDAADYLAAVGGAER